jgi:hypothetical protein
MNIPCFLLAGWLTFFCILFLSISGDRQRLKGDDYDSSDALVIAIISFVVSSVSFLVIGGFIL